MVAVRVLEGELQGAGGRVAVGFLLEAGSEGTRSRQRRVEIVHPEEEEQPVAGLRSIGARERRVLVVAPTVKTEEHRSVRVAQLPEVLVRRRRRGLAEQRL